MTEGQSPEPGAAGPALDKATRAEVRKLQEKRRDLLREALDVRVKLYQAGRSEMGGVVETSKRLQTTELDLAVTGAERIAVHERHLERAQSYVEIAKARRAAARGTEVEVLEARDFCLEAEIGLLKAGGKVKKAEK